MDDKCSQIKVETKRLKINGKNILSLKSSLVFLDASWRSHLYLLFCQLMRHMIYKVTKLLILQQYNY